jgi:formylglycine-generating enzyme required for sulfatase activity
LSTRGWRLGLAVLALAPLARANDAPPYRPVEGRTFESVLPVEPGVTSVSVAGFALRATAVTNGEFLAFVTQRPEWRRGSVARLFADGAYLAHWAGPLTLGEGALPDQPVTQVSWFAARAYCEHERARLPTWYEWELAAAADPTRGDARADPAWRQHILDWYGRPASAPLAPVGKDVADLHGIHDLAAGVWEWVDDFGALMVSNDNREQGDPDLARFCGAGALSMKDREHYAVLMRIAMLSALHADYTTRSLGFRCAR